MPPVCQATQYGAALFSNYFWGPRGCSEAKEGRRGSVTWLPGWSCGRWNFPKVAAVTSPVPQALSVFLPRRPEPRRKGKLLDSLGQFLKGNMASTYLSLSMGACRLNPPSTLRESPVTSHRETLHKGAEGPAKSQPLLTVSDRPFGAQPLPSNGRSGTGAAHPQGTLSGFLTPQNRKTQQMVTEFKPLSLGVSCYGAADN